MDQLLRVGGSLDSHRRPAGRRVLLPFEAEMCNAIGITEAEYWHFLELSETCVERDEAYALIPDIQCAPVAPILVNLAIGIALTAIGALLAPKPKAAQEDERRPDLRTESIRGRSRYQKSENFDSVQELAQLGSVIPLIYSELRQKTGGVRVSSQMLWSQLNSNGAVQVLEAMVLFGAGNLQQKPDYDGFAIGDLLVRDLSKRKNEIYFKTGASDNNRINYNDRYDEGELKFNTRAEVFSLFWPRSDDYEPYFSGARTPSTQTQFGAYSPLPNGHRFHLPYELVMILEGPGQEEDIQDRARDKKRKIEYAYPRMCGIVSKTGNTKESEVKYRIDGSEWEPDFDDEDFGDWGWEDATAIQNETRVIVDETMRGNNQFLLGEAIGSLVARPDGVWAPEEGKNADYIFLVDINGNIPIVQTALGDTSGHESVNGAGKPWERACVQRVALASVSNNRPCHATEIGFKSTVWRQMVGSANFNSHPTQETKTEFENVGASITLGTVTKYTKRYSFFRIEARKQGAKNWVGLNPGGTPFCVMGRTPVVQYNSVHILHPNSGLDSSTPTMHEFRIIPVPGIVAIHELERTGSFKVYMLDGRTLRKGIGSMLQMNGYSINYTGVEHRLSVDSAHNTEWILNNSEGFVTPRGPILALSSYGNNLPVPFTLIPERLIATRYNGQGNANGVIQRADGKYEYNWDGNQIGLGNGRAKDIVVGGQQFRFKAGSQRATGNPAGWVEVADHVSYRVEKTNSVMEPYRIVVYNGVVYHPYEGRYEFIYSGSASARMTWYVTQNVEGWQFPPSPLGTNYRYRKGPRAESRRQVYHSTDAMKNRFGKSNGKVNFGVVHRNDGKYEFFWDAKDQYNGSSVGVSSQRVIDVQQGGVTVRYTVGDLQNQAKYGDWLFPERKFSVRQNWQGTLQDTMRSGVVRKTGTTDSRFHMFWETQELARNMTGEYQGAPHVKYRAEWSFFFHNRPEDKIPSRPDWATWHINRYSSRREPAEYRITKSVILQMPDIWRIKRQAYQPATMSKWEIEQYELNVKIEQPGTKERRALVSQRNNNVSAAVELHKYDNGARRWKLVTPGDNYKLGENVKIGGHDIMLTVTSVQYGDADPEKDGDQWNGGDNYFPYNAVCDYFINSTENSSHSDNPEHEVCFVNEIIRQSNAAKPQYDKLAVGGIKLVNAREWTSFNNFSAYVKNGLRVERLVTSGRGSGTISGQYGPSSLFPEIAYSLLVDRNKGAGDLIGENEVDKDEMTTAARFCLANGFHWDGVLSQKVNLREFIFEQSAFILCDFTIKGGKFSLYPSVPFSASGYQIQYTKKPTIKALFTDGNVRNMEVTFLSPEERQPFKAVCLYRDETVNGFPETRSVVVELNDWRHDQAIEKFDMQQFCTSVDHAIMFAKYAIKIRAEVDHGIKFETTPQSAMGLKPGEYFKFSSHSTHTDRFRNGVVDPEGYVQTASGQLNSSSQVWYWKPGSEEIQRATMTIVDGRCTNKVLWGTVFTEEDQVNESRVYKLENLSYSDDGLVEVVGSACPLASNGALAILQGWQTDFRVEYN